MATFASSGTIFQQTAKHQSYPILLDITYHMDPMTHMTYHIQLPSFDEEAILSQGKKQTTFS